MIGWTLGCVLFIILLFFLYMLFLAFQTNVHTHSLLIDEWTEEKQFHVFFIADIHRRKVSEKLIQRLLGKVDVVIIGGDLTEKGVPLNRTNDNIKQLTRLGSTCYVFGNNDREVGEQNLRNILYSNGVHILENSSLHFEKSNFSVRIVGINDGFAGNVKIIEAFKEVKETDVLIFTTHAPTYFNHAKKISKPHLLLAGHLHGGQIRLGPFGIYEKGSYREKENSAELISNGYGTTAVPLRLGAKSECHLITIRGRH
ncbi:metallophosphoesterase [Psychrobacillus sp. NPDC096623]|uniref:metallophosphoesterase n=1 Tax=Psychrobacillus sp. NPDC096623 TaxID=3364492 RepID=UPI0037F73441